MNTRTTGAIFAAACCLLIGSQAQAQDVFQQGMVAAQKQPNQTMAAKSFCYCGCDREHAHKSLLDCYTTGHVPHCKTCAEEFVRIDQMNAQNQSLAQIQNTLDAEFKSRYPFPTPSPILKRYMASKRSPGWM